MFNTVPNWERIQKLRDFLETVPAKQICMDKLLHINRPIETVEEARQAECGTVGCIAGWAYLLFADPSERIEARWWPSISNTVLRSGTHDNAESFSRECLELDPLEADHAFFARWSDKSWDSGKITKAEVLAYLDKAIAAKDVMVTL
jgi:hypothetical protein